MKKDNFGNLPGDSALPEIGVYDPQNSQLNQFDKVNQGGKTKIRPTDMSGASSENGGYGYMVNGEKVKYNGEAPGNGDGSITDNDGNNKINRVGGWRFN